jgi:hypothetical protein
MKRILNLVWYDGKKWKVIKHYQPTKFDEYLLILRKEDGLTHADQKTIPIEMVLLDIHNDEFYPSTKRIDKIVKELKELKKKHKKDIYDLVEVLKNSWIDLVV